MQTPEIPSDKAPATSDLKTLAAEYELVFGSPFNRDQKGRISDCNEHYWAQLYHEHAKPIWSEFSGCFWRFQGQAGIWVPLPKSRVQFEIATMISKLFPKELQSGKAVTTKSLTAICSQLVGMSIPLDAMGKMQFDPFDREDTEPVLLLKNGRLVLHRDGSHTFTEEPGRREDMLRIKLDVAYDPEAKAPKLDRWLSRIFCDRQDDVDAIAKTYGVALSGRSQWRRIVVVKGPTRRGKAQLANLLEKLIGKEKLVAFESGNLTNRFEFSKFLGKAVIFADDIPGDFFGGKQSDIFKRMVGLARQPTERKFGEDTVYVYGDKLVLTTTNHQVKVKLGEDRDAWKDRLCILEANGPGYFSEEESQGADVKQEDKNDAFFVDNVWASEASGILNFALEGYRQVLSAGAWLRSPVQLQRAEEVLEKSDSIGEFVRNDWERHESGDVTVDDAWSQYVWWCESQSLEPWPQRTFQGRIDREVLRIFQVSETHSIDRGGKARRGWRKLRIKSLVVREAKEREEKEKREAQRAQEVEASSYQWGPKPQTPVQAEKEESK